MIKVIARDSATSLEQREDFLRDLYPLPYTHYVSLQTCDRVEVYYEDEDSTHDSIIEADTVRRLFRITAGLESPLIGECQIQHQVKQSYLQAVRQKTASRSLHLLFQKALMVGKRVRARTGISTGATSHALAAVEIIRERFPDLSRAKVVILGVNHLNENIVRYLVKHDGETLFIANRNYDKALRLAQKLGVYAFTFRDLEGELADTDILITATSAPHIIVPGSAFPRGRDMLVIDLAVPRDVDPAAAELPGIELFTTPQIEARVRSGITVRRDELDRAEAIIEEELSAFMSRIRNDEKRRQPSNVK